MKQKKERIEILWEKGSIWQIRLSQLTFQRFFMRWYLLISLITFFSLKLVCFGRYNKNYSTKFFHCSRILTTTFFRVTERVDECLTVKWAGSSVTSSKALKCSLRVLDKLKKLLMLTMNCSTSKFRNFIQFAKALWRLYKGHVPISRKDLSLFFLSDLNSCLWNAKFTFGSSMPRCNKCEGFTFMSSPKRSKCSIRFSFEQFPTHNDPQYALTIQSLS